LNDSYFKKDDILSEKDIEKVKDADENNKAFERALHILSYRAHSEKELTDKLYKKFENQVVDEVIEKLKTIGFINDADFTERYVEQSKKGEKLVRFELLKKGIDKDLVEKIISSRNHGVELDNARKIAEKVLKKYSLKPEQIKKQKLYENLTRKGFSYDIYKEIIEDGGCLK